VDERRLATTALRTTRLGLGLAAVGRPAYIDLGRARDLPGDRSPEAMYRRTVALLDVADRAGIRYLDTARSYGRAEEFLARWLSAREVRPGTFTVGSKWGYRYTGRWRLDAEVHEHKELTLARFHEQIEESTELLGPHLDLYQIHSATIESGCLDDERLLAALVDGRRAARYRAVGLTLSGPRAADALAKAIDAVAEGERVFDTVQATFNVLDPSLAGPLARAHGAGLGVIAKEIFANGRLTDTNERPEDTGLLRSLASVSGRYDETIDRIALAWTLSHPFVDVALSGAATAAQLESHVAAADLRLAADDLGALAHLAEPPARYWETRARLPWS
jgi:aryl-alcohol dehydrogenase-like predicted oxidoreductase